MHDYNGNARAYWWSIAVVGFVILANALFSIAALPTADVLQIALITIFVCAVAFFPVTIPGTSISFAGGEIFIFLALLLFGVEAAAVVAAVEGAIGAVRTSRRWTSWFATPFMAAIATSVSGYGFLAAKAMLKQQELLNGATTLLLLTVFALIYYALCNFLPSMLLAIKRAERLNVLALLKDRNWMAMGHVCSIAIASLVQLADPTVDVWVLFAALPLIFFSHWSVHAMLESADVELRA